MKQSSLCHKKFRLSFGDLPHVQKGGPFFLAGWLGLDLEG